MGELNVKALNNVTEKAQYIRQLLADIELLEQMLGQGVFEKTPVRMGAEQEFCLVDEAWEPSPGAMKVLKKLKAPNYTTELALYNMEINLDPLELGGDCFSKMHAQLDALLAEARQAAADSGLKIVLTGILPTIDKSHLSIEYMTPLRRYQSLDTMVRKLRGEDIELHIKGVDEINIHHDSILFEGCNTSFQSHLQIDPDDFVDTYNWAQAIAGPVLSIGANSPLLIGRELWQETRIALFTQSVDTRASTYMLNEREARVGFGHAWAKGSVADYFKDCIVGFKSLLTTDFEETDRPDHGGAPKLKALSLHGGTVYRWNRVCYGLTGNKPHIRIENRYLPSGPTTTDEIANMMFWIGLMKGRSKMYDAIDSKMDFKDVKSNFYMAARYGTAAQFYWNGRLWPCQELLLDHLLPMAYRGLYAMDILPKDAEYYLSVIENRIKTRNGARWTVESYRKLKNRYKPPEALRILTAAMYDRERKGYTVDAWEPPRGDEINRDPGNKKVRQLMNTKTITAQQDDSAELVLKMMHWKNIHHVPILDMRSDLVGLLTWTDVAQYLDNPKKSSSSIKSIMKTELITVTPDTGVGEARHLMRSKKINCLPVVDGNTLLGIITSNDL